MGTGEEKRPETKWSKSESRAKQQRKGGDAMGDDGLRRLSTPEHARPPPTMLITMSLILHSGMNVD